MYKLVFCLIVGVVACTDDPLVESDDAGAVDGNFDASVDDAALLDVSEPDARPSDPRAPLVAASFSEALEARGIPGGAVAIVHGSARSTFGFGRRRSDSDEPVTQTTLFAQASVSKPMTALAVLTQVEDGLADLTTPITTAFPEFSVSGDWPASEVLLEHLMTHRSGYPNYAVIVDATADRRPDALRLFFEENPEVELLSQPGAIFSYSNFGYAILGAAAQSLDGLPFAEVMHNRVIEPAGMPNATFSEEEFESSNHASSHYVDATSRFVPLPTFSGPFYQPFGGLFAGADDMAALLEAILTDDVLLSADLREQFLNHHSETRSTPDSATALSLMIEQHRGLRYFVHSGSQPGASTIIALVPEEQWGIAVMINASDGALVFDTVFDALDLYFEPDGPRDPDYSTSPETWSGYLGTYDAPTLGRFRIDPDGSRLSLEFLDGAREQITLNQYAGDTFFGRVPASRVPGVTMAFTLPFTFWPDETGDAEYLATPIDVARKEAL